ncbi:MAG: winged helix-turn-helix domain-containing protein, partial [Woeseiaceae bacterium]|nr:winged helix-turn-helix domain-containing protein [Woeseiaceae bacterium]
MEILLRLVETPEKLVERESLMEAGWGDQAGHEDALTRCIAELRHALGDHHDHPEYIQTVPRRGYRLVAPIDLGDDAERPAEKPTTYWDELQRRDVVRTSLAYAALAWLIIEVATVIGGIFDLPAWALRVVVITAIVGFPIVVALSWAVQRTSKGLALDMPVMEDAPPAPAARARRVDYVIIIALSIAVSFLLYREFRPGSEPPLLPENSVAVLPFDMLSDHAEDE